MADRVATAGDPAARLVGAGCVTLAAAMGLILLAGSGTMDPLVVWNGSASSPRGLYVLEPGPPEAGDFVIAWPPGGAAELAVSRGYLGPRTPMVKTVAAVTGARVCAAHDQVSINGRSAGVRRSLDAMGRALPWWSGCRTLRVGEVFLIGRSDPGSFDSRYFGPLPAGHVLGRARLLWAG